MASSSGVSCRAAALQAHSAPEPASSPPALGVPFAELLAAPPQDSDENVADPADDELREKDDRLHAHHGRGRVGIEEGPYIRVRCRRSRKRM